MTMPSPIEDEPPLQITFTHLHEGAKACETTLRRTADATLSNQNIDRANINIAIVCDDEIALLNEKHLNHKGPTDVLSFNLSGGGDSTLEGELVVSFDTAKREADRRDHTVEAELSLYIAHGLLHLIGFDDATEEQANKMHKIEDTILTSIGLQAIYSTSDRLETQ